MRLKGIDSSCSQDEDEEVDYCTLIPVGAAPDPAEPGPTGSSDYSVLTDVTPTGAAATVNLEDYINSPPRLPPRGDNTGVIPDPYDVIDTTKTQLPALTQSPLSQRPAQSPFSQRPTQSPLSQRQESPVRIYGQDQQEQSDFIRTLTVKQVGEAVQKLGLGRYARSFAKKMVDGRMLVLLAGEKKVLMDEFRMTRFDFLRLREYVKEGHVPQKPGKRRGCGVCLCC